jgi:pantothenate kinase
MRNDKIQFPASLQVTQQQVDLSALSSKQKAFYLDLFWELVEVYEKRKTSRVIIGIAGPTGAGKSVVAVLLKELSKQVRLPFSIEAITIDAYHYPNEYLLSHFSNGEPLKNVKGRFDTYNPKALARDLERFSAGETVSFPTYSRTLHEPVNNALLVEAAKVLLIVEGLWLLYDKGGWAVIRPLLDYALFIEADPAKAKEPVLKRHMAGGRTLQDAERHYEHVDARNSELVLTTRDKADKIIPPYYALG